MPWWRATRCCTAGSTIKHADGLLADAQARAAALWGADWCRFSVAGSTTVTRRLPGHRAARPGGDHPRTLHRSPPLGWCWPGCGRSGRGRHRSALRDAAAVAVQAVQDALAAHPAACGVILGDPSYVGTTVTWRATPGPRTRRECR